MNMVKSFRVVCQQLWAGLLGIAISSGATGISDWRWWMWMTAIIFAVALSKSADKWEIST